MGVYFLDMKKILLGLGAVIVLAVGARAFWAYRQMNTETAQPQVVTDETAGWKTYTDSVNGFSFKYAPDFTYKDLSKASYKDSNGDAIGGYHMAQFSNTSGKQFMSVNTPVREVGYEQCNSTKEEKIAIQNSNQFFTQISYDCGERDGAGKVYKSYLIRIIWNAIANSAGNKIENEMVLSSEDGKFQGLDQILSTFKFISAPIADETAVWKTYTSSQYGFSIQHPKDSLINDVDISGGRNISFSVSQGTVMVEVVTAAWHNGVLTTPANCNDFDSSIVTSRATINGIDFLKGDVSRDFSGMNSATSATEYCTMQNGTAYKIIPRMPIVSGSNLSDVNTNSVLSQIVKSFTLTK